MSPTSKLLRMLPLVVLASACQRTLDRPSQSLASDGRKSCESGPNPASINFAAPRSPTCLPAGPRKDDKDNKAAKDTEDQDGKHRFSFSITTRDLDYAQRLTCRESTCELVLFKPFAVPGPTNLSLAAKAILTYQVAQSPENAAVSRTVRVGNKVEVIRMARILRYGIEFGVDFTLTTQGYFRWPQVSSTPYEITSAALDLPLLTLEVHTLNDGLRFEDVVDVKSPLEGDDLLRVARMPSVHTVVKVEDLSPKVAQFKKAMATHASALANDKPDIYWDQLRERCRDEFAPF